MFAVVNFPFSRNTWYSFAEFIEFERYLLKARRSNERLDADLRINREAWMKLRNEEIYPTHYFCSHMGLPLSTQFRIGLPGAVADTEIQADDMLPRSMQVTTAGPLWPDGPRQWGRDHRFHMEQLNQMGGSSGWGPFRKQADGSIANRDEAISTGERDPAYLAGIEEALRRKRLNQHQNCELIVYAGGYDEAMSLETFKEIANTALRAVPLEKFVAIHVETGAEGYLVSAAR